MTNTSNDVQNKDNETLNQIIKHYEKRIEINETSFNEMVKIVRRLENTALRLTNVCEWLCYFLNNDKKKIDYKFLTYLNILTQCSRSWGNNSEYLDEPFEAAYNMLKKKYESHSIQIHNYSDRVKANLSPGLNKRRKIFNS